MKNFFFELVVAVLVVLALAEAMQGAWWLSVWLHEPLDKIFVAAAAICYVLVRVLVLKDKELAAD